MEKPTSPIRLSVAYSFEPGLIEQLSNIPAVKEVYGKLPNDRIGGGRSSYSMRPLLPGALKKAVKLSHDRGIEFNYLLNAAALYGLEQTKSGQKILRKAIDAVVECGVDAVTVSLPLLLKIVKKQYPKLRVRVGVFAQVDTAEKAKQWENLGADTICLSAIACNRDFDRLSMIRNSVKCGLQLIVNASCTPQCAWENTHMHLLTQSSAKGTKNGRFLIDYCFVACSLRKLTEPAAYIKSIWIRPEDLSLYAELGYTDFKIVERSSPAQLIVSRAKAYGNGSFNGNLWELIAPVALIKKEQKVPWWQMAHMFALILRPWYVPIASMLRMKRFAEEVIPHEFRDALAPVFIDNQALNGFLQGIPQDKCRAALCKSCGYCDDWSKKAVKINDVWNDKNKKSGEELFSQYADGSFWNIG